MALTKVVIGYSLSQGVRRWLWLPDDDSQLPHAPPARPGEGVLVGTLADYKAIGPDAMLARYLGRSATTDRCAVIDATGMVVAIVHADPAIDRHPAGRLHRDTNNKAVIGKQAIDLGLLA